MNTLQHPENEIWYILVRDLDVIGYGSLQHGQVLSTIAYIDVYESKEEWIMILAEIKEVEEVEFHIEDEIDGNGN
jgi:hypothetical protein